MKDNRKDKNGAGRHKGTEALWRDFSPAISRVLTTYETDPDLRRDLGQNVFLALMASYERIQTADNPRAYLFRIVHNVATDHIVKESRHHQGHESVELPDSRPGPEQEMNRENSRQQLLMAVRHLKLPYRQVVVLLLEDLSHAEIAQALGLSENNVRVRLNRARAMLRALLQRSGGSDEQR